jgi:hypothetical protein
MGKLIKVNFKPKYKPNNSWYMCIFRVIITITLFLIGLFIL